VITGIQARLKNLGYYGGDIDGVFGRETRAAVRQFQQTKMNRNDADGEIDIDTTSALLDHHGC